MAWLMNSLGAKKPQAPPQPKFDNVEIQKAIRESQTHIRDLQLK